MRCRSFVSRNALLHPWLAVLALVAALVLEASAAVIEVRIGEVPDRDALPLAADASCRPRGGHTWLVYGRLAGTSFSISDPSQLQAVSGDGKRLPLTVEVDTAFREFGDIIALTVMFEIDPRDLATGPARLEWGMAVTGSLSAVPVITFPEATADRIRSFLPVSPGEEDASSQFATLEIIADSHADRYYVWYLLPMAVIFILLALRKRWNS